MAMRSHQKGKFPLYGQVCSGLLLPPQHVLKYAVFVGQASPVAQLQAKNAIGLFSVISSQKVQDENFING